MPIFTCCDRSFAGTAGADMIGSLSGVLSSLFMNQKTKVQDQRGRIWTVQRVRDSDAAAEDVRFWKSMTAQERVVAVYSCLESCLQAQGEPGVPRFQRVHRRVKCSWSEIPDCGSSRAGSARETTSDEK